MRTLAEVVWGDRDKAARWLETPNAALEGRTPIEALGTAGGERRIHAILGDIMREAHYS